MRVRVRLLLWLLLLPSARAQELREVWRVAGVDPVRGAYAGKAQLGGSPAELSVEARLAFEDGAREVLLGSGCRREDGGLELQRAAGLIGLLAAAPGETGRLDPEPARGAPRLSGAWSGGRTERWVRLDAPAPAVLVVGHRGAPWAAPENTLPSYEAALAAGADGIEIDLCLTREGEVVVWHDRDPDDPVALARQAGVEGLPHLPWVPGLGGRFRRPVEELTKDELRAHYGYGRPRSLSSIPGWLLGGGDVAHLHVERVEARIPTLGEVLRWTATRAPGLLRLYLDTKLPADDPQAARRMGAAVGRAVLGDPLARAAGVADRLVFLNVAREQVLALRQGWEEAGAPGTPRWVRDLEGLGTVDPLAEAEALGSSAISLGWMPPRELLLTRDAFVARLTAARKAQRPLDVTVWTLNAPEEWALAVEHGAHAIMTDRPDELLTFLRGE